MPVEGLVASKPKNEGLFNRMDQFDQHNNDESFIETEKEDQENCYQQG